MKYLIAFVILSFFLTPNSVFARGGQADVGYSSGRADVVPAAEVGQTAVSSVAGQTPQGAQAAGQAPQYQSCSQAYSDIQKQCSRNPELEKEKYKKTNFLQLLSGAKSTGSASNQEGVLQVAEPSRRAYVVILAGCKQMANSCETVCRNEIQAAQGTPQIGAVMQYNQNVMKHCIQEKQAVIADATPKIMELEKIIALAKAGLDILKGLKGSGGPDALSLEDPDDPCEKYNGMGILVGQCGNEAGSATASRATAGLTGVGAAGLTDTSGDGLLQSSSLDDPGGQGLNSKASGSGFNGSGAGGLGGFGALGAVGGGGTTGAAGEEGLDTDIHKGFMSADGAGGGGGFSSGGGSKGVSGKFGRGAGGAGNDNLQQAALQRKLSKYTSKSKRGLASKGSANGPFQDNWSVIKKAYKHNKKTMYHQK